MLCGAQVNSSDALGRMTTIRKPDLNLVPVAPLVARADEEGLVTGVSCPLNAAVDLHDIAGCKDLLESYFMQVMPLSLAPVQLFCNCFASTWSITYRL